MSAVEDDLPQPRPLEPIVSQHAEEAAFLWVVRRRAVRQPHYDLTALAKLEGRLEAHLDGLRIAGDAGWAQASENLALGGAGEVFVHPADCVGELGAAVAPCVAAFAMSAARKGYAPGPGTLCHFACDDGRRGALVLRSGLARGQ